MCNRDQLPVIRIVSIRSVEHFFFGFVYLFFFACRQKLWKEFIFWCETIRNIDTHAHAYAHKCSSNLYTSKLLSRSFSFDMVVWYYGWTTIPRSVMWKIKTSTQHAVAVWWYIYADCLSYSLFEFNAVSIWWVFCISASVYVYE